VIVTVGEPQPGVVAPSNRSQASRSGEWSIAAGLLVEFTAIIVRGKGLGVNHVSNAHRRRCRDAAALAIAWLLDFYSGANPLVVFLTVGFRPDRLFQQNQTQQCLALVRVI